MPPARILHASHMHPWCALPSVEQLQTEKSVMKEDLTVANESLTAVKNQLFAAIKQSKTVYEQLQTEKSVMKEDLTLANESLTAVKKQLFAARDEQKQSKTDAAETQNVMQKGLGLMIVYMMMHLTLSQLRSVLRSMVKNKRMRAMVEELDFSTTASMMNPGLRYFRLAFAECMGAEGENADEKNSRVDFCCEVMKFTCYQMDRYVRLSQDQRTCHALKELNKGHNMYSVVEAGLHLRTSTSNDGNFYPMTGLLCLHPSCMRPSSCILSPMCLQKRKECIVSIFMK